MSNILIVEDNPDIAMLYQRLFFRHETHIFDDANTTINHLKNVQPDLVILDMHLPRSRGLDVLEYMRAQPGLEQVPVLGISADDMLKKEAKAKGITAFFTKPLDIDQLLTATSHILE
jgi:CheY-like chemotaxis protein